MQEWERGRMLLSSSSHVFVFSSHIIILNRIPPRLDSYKKWLLLQIHSSYWSCRWSQLGGPMNSCLCVRMCVYTVLLTVYQRIVLIAISVIENPTLALVVINKLNRHRYVFGRCSSAYVWMLSLSVHASMPGVCLLKVIVLHKHLELCNTKKNSIFKDYLYIRNRIWK